ncbi:MAG TPA: hypothetical protein PKE03_10995 [Bacteroidales bacterium]|nr:hypothetical protein [Bacteroidales bacterium]
MERNCLECGEALMGRADKKFCNDQCRSAHYQRKNAAKDSLIRSTNNQLKKNYTILRTLNKDGKTRVKKSTLLKEGFIFGLITGIYNTRDNKTYYYVYDQGYLPIENEFYILVVSKESETTAR